MTPRYTLAAREDADAAIAFVAADNPAAAERLAARLDEAARLLIRFPRLGTALGKDRRRFTVSGTPFRLVYRPVQGGIIILRIRHGASGWPPVSS